jgi:phage gpG-like protein
MNGIRWRANGKSVEVTANTKYAEIINEGGNMRIFGKHPAKMPKRQFMGKSKVLNEKIEKKVLQDLKKIMR